MIEHGIPGERRDRDCLSDFALDRLRLGELEGAAEHAPAKAHVEGCAHCQGRLVEMAAVAAPALDVVALLPARAVTEPAPRSRWARRVLWLSPVVAAAAVALLLLPGWRPGERVKGRSWQLGVVAQYPNGRVTGVSSGAVLAPGDRVRFEVSAPSNGFVAVISVDARGQVTPFVPAAGQAAAVPAGARRLLDGAVRLDDSLGPERLVLVACPRPLPVAEVVAAGKSALASAEGHLDRMPDLGLPCVQTSFWIRKEVRP
jgi:hypothetical protein